MDVFPFLPFWPHPKTFGCSRRNPRSCAVAPGANMFEIRSTLPICHARKSIGKDLIPITLKAYLNRNLKRKYKT
jgi:hypothetical protein